MLRGNFRWTARSVRAMALSLPLLLCACKADLYTHLGEREATEMLAILLRHDIDAARVTAKDGTSSLQVDSARIADAVALMKANQLPRSEYANMGSVFEQKGIVSSPIAERARLLYALSQELSRTLSDIDGVLTARVHVVLPRNDPMRNEGAVASAAVFIRHDARRSMADLLPQIKTLVAGSIEGLSYNKVAVILLPVDTTEESLAMPPMTTHSATVAKTAQEWLPSGLTVLALVGGGALLLRRRFTHVVKTPAPLPSPVPVAVPLRKAA